MTMMSLRGMNTRRTRSEKWRNLLKKDLESFAMLSTRSAKILSTRLLAERTVKREIRCSLSKSKKVLSNSDS